MLPAVPRAVSGEPSAIVDTVAVALGGKWAALLRPDARSISRRLGAEVVGGGGGVGEVGGQAGAGEGFSESGESAGLGFEGDEAYGLQGGGGEYVVVSDGLP